MWNIHHTLDVMIPPINHRNSYSLSRRTRKTRQHVSEPFVCCPYKTHNFPTQVCNTGSLYGGESTDLKEQPCSSLPCRLDTQPGGSCTVRTVRNSSALSLFCLATLQNVYCSFYQDLTPFFFLFFGAKVEKHIEHVEHVNE